MATQCPQWMQVSAISPVSMVIALDGQSLTHLKQRVHFSRSITGMMIDFWKFKSMVFGGKTMRNVNSLLKEIRLCLKAATKFL
jgi:hypothetical protein